MPTDGHLLFFASKDDPTWADDSEDIEFVIPWGIHSPIVSSYHNPDDPAKFQAGILSAPDGRPNAMILYKDSLYSVEPESKDDAGQIAESIIVLSLLAPQK